MEQRVKEFLQQRIPLYIDNETAQAVIVNTSNLKDCTFAEIFSNIHYPWLFTTRGYLKDNHLILYVNDYDIPNVNISLLQYLFTYFPKVEWIGLGCIKGNPGEWWKPRLVIRRDNSDLENENSHSKGS